MAARLALLALAVVFVVGFHEAEAITGQSTHSAGLPAALVALLWPSSPCRVSGRPSTHS